MLRFKKAWKGYRKPSQKPVPPEDPTDRITHIGAECDRDSKGECRPGKISTYGADETDFRPWYPDINRGGGSRIASQGKRTGDQQLPAPDASTLQDRGDPHDPIQSGRSRGKSWRSGYAMVRTDHYQPKREAGLTALLGLPQLQSISRRGQPKHSAPSKLSWNPFPLSMHNIRFVPTLCSRPFSDRSHLQKTIAVKDKIEILRSRIAMLEKLFEEPASDGKETERREGLLTYASGFCSDWMLKPCQ
jgi:hypothetical protein